MKRNLFGLRLRLAAAILVAVGLTRTAPAAPPGGPPYRPDAVLVAFKRQATLAARLDAVNRNGLQIDLKNQSPYFAELRLGPAARAAGRKLEDVLAALRRDPAVRIAEPDYPGGIEAVPNDPRFGELYGLDNTGQAIRGAAGTPDADIDAPEAWEVTTGSDDVVVAVIDTGVDYNHPDLAPNILRDNTGAVVGYDFANDDPDPMDDSGHGTHCAGTVGAAGDNGVGVVGVCPNVKIMPIKWIRATGTSSTSSAIKAVDFARENGAHILSNSWRLSGPSQLMLEAIRRAEDAGILFVNSAGNDNSDNDVTLNYPKYYTRFVNNMVVVAATDNRDQKASFSNYGALWVDIAAPGNETLSTYPTSRGSYTYLSGTSMAAPHVAGAAALIRARYPDITLAQLKARLRYGADYVPALASRLATGRLNVHSALEDDPVAPGSPGGLTATHHASRALLLAWTASGDDGEDGAARFYELRYSTEPITEDNFAAATPARGLPGPGEPGSAQSYLLAGLAPGSAYYVAVRARDNVGNASALATAGPLGTRSERTETPVLEDDTEDAPQFAGQAPWAVTAEDSRSPGHSYTDSPGELYGNSRNLSLTQIGETPLAGIDPELTFWARTSLEPTPNRDYLYVEVSTDGGRTWPPSQRLRTLTGRTAWTRYALPLNAYAGRTVKVRFRLSTNTTVQDDGVWVDDIRIATEELVPVDEGPAPE